MLKKLLTTVFLLKVVFVFGQREEEVGRYAETITTTDLKKRLEIIASDEFEGRETGRPGQKKAAAYIRNQFIEFGYEPLESLQGYYQPYRLLMTYPDTVNLIIDKDSLRFLKDMYYFPGFGDMVIDAENLLYLGYGISDKSYNDYAQNEVGGRVLLISSGEPHKKKNKSLIDPEQSSTSWTSDWTQKIELAEVNGAKALLIIDDKFSSSVVQHGRYIKRPSISVENRTEAEKSKMPVIYISSKMADQILQKAGFKKGHKALEKAINKSRKPINKELNFRVKIEVKKSKEKLVSENVLAYLEGEDKKEELVVITAHYDHLGKKGEKIFNGADDDGSGTTSMLELAQAFALAKKEGNGPRRSMLFMAVSGEEKGLLGSEFYSDNPVFPLESTVANLNIDMIGRIDKHHAPDSNYVYIIGADKLSNELHRINEKANDTYTKLELDYKYNDENDPNRFYYRSDHYNFAKHGVPVIFYFTGVHEDYHQPTDTVDKIMFKKTEKIARLVFYTAWELANREERIKVDVLQE